MNRWLALAAFALVAVAVPAGAAEITGQYVEARSTDVWTGPCFANAEMNLGGKQGVLAWKIDKGSLGDVRLDGLGVVAVVLASDTLGIEQTGQAKAVLIVDARATAKQKDALVRLAKEQGGQLVANVVAVQSAAVELDVCECKGGACAKLKAAGATLATKCLDDDHKVCGNESAFFPPLAKNVQAKPALAAEFGFSGKGLNETWKEMERRGAYVGSFRIR